MYRVEWTADWYKWDYTKAREQSLKKRDARAKELRKLGYKVRLHSLRSQRISLSGIDSGKSHIDLIAIVYMLSYR